MPNLRGKTWDTTTPATVNDAQYWEDHLISDADAALIGQVILPPGGTTGQVLTKITNTSGDADWADPASSGHTIENASGTSMPYQSTLQFLNAEVSNDSVNSKTVVDCHGEKGDPGDAATVTVGTVTTLPAGSDATVTNSGTTSAAVFNFGIPQGQDGSGAVSSVNSKTGNVVLDLGDMDDVTITSASDNDAIVYDSGDWVNIPLPLVALTGSYGDLQNKPALKTVATSGSYNDLDDKPSIPTVSVDHNGTAGENTVRKQRIAVDSTYYDVDGSVYMEKSDTSTSATFNFANAAITSTSAIDVYTNTWGDNPTSVTVDGSLNKCTVTFSAAAVRTVRIYIK